MVCRFYQIGDKKVGIKNLSVVKNSLFWFHGTTIECVQNLVNAFIGLYLFDLQRIYSLKQLSIIQNKFPHFNKRIYYLNACVHSSFTP